MTRRLINVKYSNDATLNNHMELNVTHGSCCWGPRFGPADSQQDEKNACDIFGNDSWFN